MRGWIKLFKIAVCDRNQDVVRELTNWIETDGKQEACSIETTCYNSAEELIWDMEERCRYDVVFLEFEINHCKGTEYAKAIAETDVLCEIIFIANSEEHAYEAYSVHPFSYLKKPISKEYFHQVFAETCAYLMQSKDNFSFSIKQRHYQILLKNILYFQSDKTRVTLFTTSGEEYVFYDTMKNVEQYVHTLSMRFIRTHQSFLVNYKHIRAYHYEQMEMRNGAIIPISEDRRKKVHNKYYFGK